MIKKEEQEIFEEARKEVFEQPQKWHEKYPYLRKLIIAVISLFLVFLMVAFIFAGYPISDIIRSQLESNPLENNIIELEDFKIYFTDSTITQLQNIYFGEQENEFSVCLSGERIDGDYYISSLYQPEMYQQTFNHVTFESCSQETLIMLHSHPYKSCLASETDLNTLMQTQFENPDMIMLIMCEPGRFSVYS